MQSGDGSNGISELPFAFCVKFLRQESYCTPVILLFEMNRNITEEEVPERDYTEKIWMDGAEIDSRPFLHFLQNLTYRGLGESDNQLHAIGVLESYTFDMTTIINLYHPETSFNLVGHCN
ncbi:hypothetical protein DPMN_171656 [Dreissena polymorpha]|uniref:Uncharacterized protein n=1 Tax=Dreissena polymorpha TaxID=45954 RepID=A0A9D4DZB9_DREPO|nr:hypothetical protein DPMN_171656 [Dreissena polymorpha]